MGREGKRGGEGGQWFWATSERVLGREEEESCWVRR